MPRRVICFSAIDCKKPHSKRCLCNKPQAAARRRRVAILGAAVAASMILRVGAAGAQSLNVNAGNSPYSVTSGSLTYQEINIGDGSNGTLNQSGGSLTANGGFNDAIIGIHGVGTINLSGGTFSASNVNLGLSGNGFINQTGGLFTAGGVDLSVDADGTYTISAGTVIAGFYIGGGATGTLTVSGTGLVEANALQVGQYSTGIINLDGGTIRTLQFSTGFGSSTFNFNGGTLQAGASSAGFMQGLTTANVRNGGAVIDSNGFSVTIAQALLHSSIGGDAAIDGGLTKVGAGSLILAGANTYTGMTNINSGMLSLSGGSVSIASSAGVSLNASGTEFRISDTPANITIKTLSGVAGSTVTLGTNTLILSNAAGIFAGAISGGNGGLILNGGTETLSGTSNFGNTTVNGGTLNVTGSISDPTINSGGTFTGTGSVGATTVNAGGSFAPGSGTPGTSMTVNGSLALTSGALYVVAVNPSTASFATVTGAATLGGATVSANFASGSYISKQYTILNAGSINGTFSPTTLNTGLSSNFSDTLSYDATHAYLNLKLNFGIPSNLNGNQQAVGNALTSFFNATGGIPLVYGALTPAGLTQVSGETATGSQQTTFDAMSQFMGLLTDPFMSRGGGFGAPSPASGYAEENSYAAKSNPTDAFAMFNKAPIAGAYDPRWSVWTAGYGGSQSTSGNAVAGTNNTTSSVAGTAVGADYLFSPNTIAGFALAGGGTNFSVANGGSGRSDLFQAGAYIRHTEGAAYISAALAYGWQDITTNRTVTAAGFDQLRAEFNANAWSGRVEGGYRFVSPATLGIGITPYAAAQFVTFDLPAYTEQAVAGTNSFALAYGASNVTDPRSELGIRTDESWAVNGGILALRGRFTWAHDYDPNRSIAATFQSLPGAGFVVNGAAQAADSALTTASIEMKWRNGWSAAGTLEGEFSNVTSSYAGKGVVRYAW